MRSGPIYCVTPVTALNDWKRYSGFCKGDTDMKNEQLEITDLKEVSGGMKWELKWTPDLGPWIAEVKV